MDRSFLTDESLIAASRDFVCIRLATYEDAAEAHYLASIFRGRSGELENTVFCLLAPDGKQRLSRASRSPQMVFRSVEQMATEMKEIASRYPTKDADGQPTLPRMSNVRLALNVASCDSLPLIVCLGESEQKAGTMGDRLASVVAGADLAGRFVFATSHDVEELKVIRGDVPKSGYVVVEPGEFGIDGNLIKTLSDEMTAADLKQALLLIAADFRRTPKDHREHVSKGHRKGIDWETVVPVTDPMSNRAREQGRRKR